MKKSILSLVLLLGAAGSAYAIDPVYKSTMPDGRIVYGEVPQPGAKRVDKVAAPPESAGVTVATENDKARVSAIPPSEPKVTVIPQPSRPPTKSDQQGYRVNPNDALPGRSAY